LAILSVVAASACAQGVQDSAADQDSGELGDSGGASAGSSTIGASGSTTTSAGAGSVTSAGATAGGSVGSGGSIGASGTGGASAGGTTGAAGKGGAASGGTANGGAASAGATGSGGAANGGAANGGGSSAGATSSGGATGSGGSVSNGGFVVQYACMKTAAMSPYVEAEINAKNTGTTTIAVAELKLRYYFTDEPRVTNQMTNNFSHISTSGSNQTLNVTSVVAGLVPTETGADTYIEFSFTSDHALAPNEAMDFAWQMDGPDQSKDIYNQSNDYSFDASKTTLTNWDHVVLFHNGTVVWGALP
jgi:cellulose 1,4-beta-cellobiosidase